MLKIDVRAGFVKYFLVLESSAQPISFPGVLQKLSGIKNPVRQKIVA
jgi:hypothetical protein